MNYNKLQTTNILGATLIATVLECGPHWTGNEFVDSYLLQFENGSTMNISTDRVGKDFFPFTDNSTPSVGAVASHSFVLASLFDVESMSLDIPEHVLENDPAFDYVTCPCCDGEKWLEVEGNVWTKALFSDHRMAFAHRALNHSYKVCGRCSGVGEVLDDLTTFDEQTTFDELGCSLNIVQTEYENIDLMNTLVTGIETPTVDELIARVEHLLTERHARIKTGATDPRSTPVKGQQWQLAA